MLKTRLSMALFIANSHYLLLEAIMGVSSDIITVVRTLTGCHLLIYYNPEEATGIIMMAQTEEEVQARIPHLICMLNIMALEENLVDRNGRFNYCNESLQKIFLNPVLSIVKADGL